MQGVTRRQGLFSRAILLGQRHGSSPAKPRPAEHSLPVINEAVAAKSGARGAAWHRSPGYDLRRTRRDLPNLTRNAAHGGINQRFPNYVA